MESKHNTYSMISETSPIFFLLAAVGLAVAYKLVPPIIWPTIITYPWEEEEKEDKIVILAGSYNPPHLGHLKMLEYLSNSVRLPPLTISSFHSPQKYLVSPEERVDLLRQILQTSSITNVRVEVVEGYIWRWAKREGATVFYRGIRSWEKDGHDERALQILNTWGPLLLGPLFWPIPTIYIEGDPNYNHISSTLIREICRDGKEAAEDSLDGLVPKTVAKSVSTLYSGKDK
eukprot:scaffold3875_cov123-Cylindrotheca_fusiformis.AAC.14